VLTSGLTFLTVLALFFLGGEVLHGFAFTLVIGTIVGTYSSIFIASPIVVGWIERGQVKVKTA
jgi:preprotein translocase subunit SecF